MTLHFLRPSHVLKLLRSLLGNDQMVVVLLSIPIGAIGGGAVVLFREALQLVQWLIYGSPSEHLFSGDQTFPWWLVLAAPTLGGLVVGFLISVFLKQGRSLGVADVIEANALQGGRMSATDGVKAAIINAISIGVGASVGREGPAVHLGASLGSLIAKRLHLTRTVSRTMLGCGVAAAVAASFNSPIAGALFAAEVVLGHYALSAFAPIVIGSVTGTAISRAWYGDFPAFQVADHAIASFWEFPAFAGLGIVAGLAALLFMQLIMLADRTARDTIPKPWLRPAVGGFLVGLIGLFFPQVLGIGYGATEQALANGYPLAILLALLAAKMVATACSLGFGFGGGVFSPALVIGAMLGGAYGTLVTMIAPELSSGADAYTLVGMGAVAAAVLGAPISTSLIIFELTSNYALTMAVMVAVVLASVTTHRFHGGSFFAWQLERRGLDLKGGFETTLLRAMTVISVVSDNTVTITPERDMNAVRAALQRSPMGEIFVLGNHRELLGTITLANLSDMAFDHDYDDLIRATDVMRPTPPALELDDTLEQALKLMRECGEEHIAVVDSHATKVFVGCAHESDVMRAYNRALVAHRREEHR